MDNNVDQAYRANPLLKKCGVKHEFTQEQIEEYLKCRESPVYFTENYFKIVNLDKGLINIELYDYQKEILELYHENKFCILKLPRQSAKTTTTVAYILWASLFNDNYVIAILANKGSLAREILDRYQLAYEQLPMWLQQGVVTFNKGSVELENGSKILAASTSSSAIRGYSINLIFMDEVAHIHNNLADDFFTSVFPTISSGKNTKLIMASTPRGMNLFYKFWTDAKANRNGFAPYEVHWSQVPGRDQAWYEETIKAVGPQKFDQEYNCHFLGSTNTLISGEKLATLAFKDPVSRMADVVIYERPVKEEFDDETMDQISTDHMYAMVVDVSEGKNLDYSAFSVFDVSTIPYKQVAVYRNNTIPPMVFPNVIKTCAEYYNDAHVLIEINNSPQVAEILLEDLEYENVFKVKSGNKKAQTITLGAGRGIAYGLKTSPLTKRIGCSTLKTLIENDKLIVNDFETISELTTFVNNGKSFSAEEGCNDDIVMTLVNFGWLVTQRLFKELVENDIRKQLQLEHFEYIDEDQLPLGENYKGNDIPFYIEDDAVWVEVGKHSSKDPYGDIFKNLIDF
nr:MAG: hypothetical protein [Caudoviricetes sp.]